MKKHVTYSGAFISLSFILLIGLFLRLDQFIYNRALWLDEALFAANILARDWAGLLKSPLEYTGYIAPPGFLILSEISTVLLGTKDYVLRAVPLLCGLLSLALYPILAKKFISRKAVPYAVFFFSLSHTLIVYSSMFKQYSGDVLSTICIYLVTYDVYLNRLNFKRSVYLISLGIFLIFFSHTSLIVLFVSGILLSYQAVRSRDWKRMCGLMACGSLWFVSFCVLYYMFIRSDGTLLDKWLYQIWGVDFNAFMPSPFTPQGLWWIYVKVLDIFENLALFDFAGIAAIVTIFGGWTLFLERKPILFLLTGPLVTALVLSYFQLYGFHDRLVMFLLPSLYLILAQGISKITLPFFKRNSWNTVALQCLVVALFVFSSIKDNHIDKRYHQIQEMKLSLEFYKTKKREGDKIYIYYWSEPAFRFYAERYGVDFSQCSLINPIPSDEYVKEVEFSRRKSGAQPVSAGQTSCYLGSSEWLRHVSKDFAALKGQGRVWFLFTHATGDFKLYLTSLDDLGQAEEHHYEAGCSIHLYTL